MLSEDFHSEFEENVRRMMSLQQRRPLAGEELITRNKFVRKDGSKARPLSCVCMCVCRSAARMLSFSCVCVCVRSGVA